MAREINKLSARRVQTITTAGRHADGGGLYLVVEASGAKRWVFLYRLPGKRREMGLGPVLSVPLARARELAAAAREKITAGIDPLDKKRAPPPDRPRPTFGDVATTFMDDRASTWRNAAHRGQWKQTLETQAADIWAKPVAEVGTDDVLKLLRPMWQTKAETARRIRGRLERILDAAKAQGLRAGENPARWKGHLDAILPKAAKLTRGHHPAMPYKRVPSFMIALRGKPAFAARALEFVILTAARSGEVRKMLAGEIDMAGAVWTVPAERMKAKREHRVPLSAPALALLGSIRIEDRKPEALVFPGPNGVMSDAIFGALLDRMGQSAYTTHGFRSSFRDWAADETEHRREIIEAALAHLVGDQTERAYRRGDALAKRRHLMDDWARFVASACGSDDKNVSKSA